MGKPLYPFFDGTDKPHMTTVWKNIHYTELKDSIVFDTLPNTLLVGFEEEPPFTCTSVRMGCYVP